MKVLIRWSWLASATAALSAMVIAGAFLSGCSSAPEKPSGAKKGDAQKKVEPGTKAVKPPAEPEEPAEKPKEPVAKPEEPAEIPAEPAMKPEEPAEKPEEPAMKPEEPAEKPEEPAMKPEEPAEKPEEPAMKPEEPAEKPEEPAAKPAEKPEEPAVKSEEPATKPLEVAVKPEEPAVKAPAESADAVKVSKFAPATDLENQVADYVKALQKAVATEEEYKDLKEKVVKDASTLSVVALTLGLHDQDNKYKANAADIIKAAQELAAATDYDAAKKGVAAVEAAADGKDAKSGELKWEKVADLAQLMKAVPLINTKLKRSLQGTRFKSKAKDTAGYTAVLAAIAQASIVDASPAKDEEQVKQWQKFCTVMRDDAGAANAAIHAGNQEAALAGVEQKLAKSCDDCHEVFHKAALGKTDVEEK